MKQVDVPRGLWMHLCFQRWSYTNKITRNGTDDCPSSIFTNTCWIMRRCKLRCFKLYAQFFPLVRKKDGLENSNQLFVYRYDLVGRLFFFSWKFYGQNVLNNSSLCFTIFKQRMIYKTAKHAVLLKNNVGLKQLSFKQ